MFSTLGLILSKQYQAQRSRRCPGQPPLQRWWNLSSCRKMQRQKNQGPQCQGQEQQLPRQRPTQQRGLGRNRVRVVTGALRLTVDDTRDFAVDPRVFAALKAGIAAALQGIEERFVEIVNITIVGARRLADDAYRGGGAVISHRALSSTGEVLVNYRILIPESASSPSNITADTIMSSGSAFKGQFNALLTAAGLSYSVKEITVLRPTVTVEDRTVPSGIDVSVAVPEDDGLPFLAWAGIGVGCSAFALGCVGCGIFLSWYKSRSRQYEGGSLADGDGDHSLRDAPPHVVDDEVHNISQWEARRSSSRSLRQSRNDCSAEGRSGAHVQAWPRENSRPSGLPAGPTVVRAPLGYRGHSDAEAEEEFARVALAEERPAPVEDMSHPATSSKQGGVTPPIPPASRQVTQDIRTAWQDLMMSGPPGYVRDNTIDFGSSRKKVSTNEQIQQSVSDANLLT